MSRKSGIYAIVNKINGKRYIGSSVNIPMRWRCHLYELRRGKHHSKHLQSAWNKYGEDSFCFEILEECGEENLLSSEQKYLDTSPEYNTVREAGRVTGYRFSDEEKTRMSIIHTGFKHTEESRRKMSAFWSGKPRGKYSLERCLKMSESRTGRKCTDKQRKALELGRGKKSEETLKKMSESQIGYKPTQETLEKLRSARRKRIISEETKKKTSETMRDYFASKRNAVECD